MATAALAAVVAPAVSATSTDSYKAPVETALTPKVKQLNLNVATKNAQYGLAWEADEKAGEAVVTQEKIVNEAERQLTELKKVLEVAELELANLTKNYYDALGYFTRNEKPAEFDFATEAAVTAHYNPLITAAQNAVADAKANIAIQENTVKTVKTTLAKLQADKVATKKAADAAKAELDKAIEEARAAGIAVPVETTEVTRLYKAASSSHYFTTNPSRIAGLEVNGFKKEGVAFKAPVTGVPVYAIVNPATGYNHFTANAEEIAGLVAQGWTKSEVVFYTFAEESDAAVSVNRLYNPNSGRHHFTSNAEEIAGLVAKGWNNEGHAYFVAK